jgi:decaprenyl-phosphate phosphoribosyltransferase
MVSMRVPQDQPPVTSSGSGKWRVVGGGAGARTGPPLRERRPTALLRATRPRQWVKNLLVFAAPGAAGEIFHMAVFWRCVAAFAIFVAASSAAYLVNDILDKDADRLHPTKRSRPIAAGLLPMPLAWASAAVLAAAALVATALVSGATLTLVVGTYVVISLAYSLGLKRVPVIEMACVGSGFVLRAMAGGAAVHVPLSPWFLLVTSFGALFVVGGKRSAEHKTLGEDRADHRAALGEYPASFLRVVRALAASVCVTTYCLWAFDRYNHLDVRARGGHLVWFELSIVPFVLAVLAVELAVERGLGGAPEELALKDRTLQALGLAWVGLLLIGIYS